MNRLLLYGDFDWLESPKLIGTLGYESLRGSDSYSFEFDKEWLANYGSIFLSADINSYPGRQYTQPGKDIFGCFCDALPDRWGRTLLNRREQIQAKEERRPARHLSSFDYLIGIDDFSRMGGFRFKETPAGAFINSRDNLCIPPITDIRTLVVASREFERSEERDLMPEKKWIRQLVHPGTSLGGARPKAVVVDEEGSLYVAKFPSRKDDYDVALWEYHSHLLAKEAGVVAAETRVIHSGDTYHTFLSKRFDRTVEGKRIHFASAMTLLGLTDGCDAGSGNGYLDIVDFILQHCCDVKENILQLYRRVAFNIAIGNCDDHFRNHGFLLTPKGWTLAPAYDLNPTLGTYQSLLINSSTNESNLQILLDSCKEYMINKEEARAIIGEVMMGIGQWEAVAVKLGISKREIDMFQNIYKRNRL